MFSLIKTTRMLQRTSYQLCKQLLSNRSLPLSQKYPAWVPVLWYASGTKPQPSGKASDNKGGGRIATHQGCSFVFQPSLYKYFTETPDLSSSEVVNLLLRDSIRVHSDHLVRHTDKEKLKFVRNLDIFLSHGCTLPQIAEWPTVIMDQTYTIRRHVKRLHRLGLRDIEIVMYRWMKSRRNKHTKQSFQAQIKALQGCDTLASFYSKMFESELQDVLILFHACPRRIFITDIVNFKKKVELLRSSGFHLSLKDISRITELSFETMSSRINDARYNVDEDAVLSTNVLASKKRCQKESSSISKLSRRNTVTTKFNSYKLAYLSKMPIERLMGSVHHPKVSSETASSLAEITKDELRYILENYSADLRRVSAASIQGANQILMSINYFKEAKPQSYTAKDIINFAKYKRLDSVRRKLHLSNYVPKQFKSELNGVTVCVPKNFNKMDIEVNFLLLINSGFTVRAIKTCTSILGLEPECLEAGIMKMPTHDLLQPFEEWTKKKDELLQILYFLIMYDAPS